MTLSNGLTLPAPAKINLFLHILGRRDDGYHELQTAFQFLDHSDHLSFRLRDDGEIKVSPELPGVDPRHNLIWRAADRLRQHLGGDLPGVDIHCDKCIPLGGGLGGGSSDAATTLLGLNHLWRGGLDLAGLAALGLPLGADIPVFVHGRAAWAEGVGERLTFIEPEEAWYLVLKPACQVSTALIFSHQGLTRNSPRLKIAPAFEGDNGRFRNDCEAIVRQLYPEVGAALDWLRKFAPARLTGTGACIFGRFPTQSRALGVLSQKPSGIEGFVARSMNLSPLHAKLDELS